MQKGRLLWAAVMCAVAVTVLMGYTEAGALRAADTAEPPPQALSLPELPPAAPPELPAPEEPEPAAPSLWMTVVDAGGGVLYVTGADGAAPVEAAVNERGEAAFFLPPGRYTLADEAGRAGAFTLAENAAILDAAGDARTDGELLYLGPPPEGSSLP